MGELDGKVAIITGAGRRRSIGYSTAISLAKLGADIVVTGTGRDPATFPPDEKAMGWRDVESTADDVRALGRRALPLVVDVTDVEQTERHGLPRGQRARQRRHPHQQRRRRHRRRPSAHSRSGARRIPAGWSM